MEEFYSIHTFVVTTGYICLTAPAQGVIDMKYDDYSGLWNTLDED